jgi:hypothetical protein
MARSAAQAITLTAVPGIIPRPAVEGQGPGAPAAGGYGGLGEAPDVRGSFNKYGAPQAGYAGTNGYGGGAPPPSYGRDNRYGPPGDVPSSGGNPYANISQTSGTSRYGPGG